MKKLLLIAAALALATPATAKPLDANGNTVIGTRPADCPRAWCGCGLRKFLGIADHTLDLAIAWLKYPRTEPKPGAVAVKKHHVMLLESHVRGTVWKVRSYNDAKHLAVIRNRDVRRYVFVEAR